MWRPACILGLLIAVSTMDVAAKPLFEPVAFNDLAGWNQGRQDEALGAFRLSCGEILADGRAFDRTPAYGGKRDDWLEICRLSSAAADARQFFETNFVALRVNDPVRPAGLFTGYYEPEANGSRVRTG